LTGHLKIDPEFEKVIPPLSEDEFKQLEKNILSEGEIFTPLFVWNEVIIDGHHRFKIICSHPDIKYRVLEKEFANRYEAIAWICNNQLGRRNLTDKDREYLIGKRYDSERMAHGSQSRFQKNMSSLSPTDQIDPLEKKEGSHITRERIAQETGTSEGYVERASKFAKGIDAAEEIAPGIKKDILSGQIKPTKPEVIAIASASPEERPAMVDNLRKPKEKREKQSKISPADDKRRIYQSIDAISANLEKPKEAISIDKVFDIIRGANRTYMETCDYYYEKYPELLAEKGYKATTFEVISELKKYIVEIEG